MQRIGIFGGTFNPPHKGHTYIAREAKRLANLDRMIFIPCYVPPHKEVCGGVSAEHRFNMTGIAISRFPEFEISDIEIKAGGKSYTAKTLEKLKEIYPHDRLCFVVGGDSLRDMESWYHPERIFALATIIAFARGEVDGEKLAEYAKYYKEKYGAVVEVIDVAPMDVSSSQIRGMISDGFDVSGFVDAHVMEYIEENGIFK